MKSKIFGKVAATVVIAGGILFGATTVPSAEAAPANLVPVACYPTPDGGSQNVYLDTNSGTYVVFVVE